MSATGTFAGSMAEDRVLLRTREQNPFVSCLGLVDRRSQRTAREWVRDEPASHPVTVCGSLIAHVHCSCWCGDSIVVHGLKRTHSRPGKEAAKKQIEDVVVVGDSFGEVGVLLTWLFLQIERAESATVRVS